MKLRSGENPALWRDNLEHMLPKANRTSRKHHPALPYGELPGLMMELQAQPSIPARALEFTILTAVRTGEARIARWSEVDLRAGVWTIPGARMKGDKDHRVPLSDRALAKLHPGVTVHGFRSTFRDWAAETTSYPNHVVEMALAHAISNGVEAAYRRGDLFENRRRLMQEWADYCASSASDWTTVSSFQGGGRA